jgi:ribonuclease HI/exonuclease III
MATSLQSPPPLPLDHDFIIMQWNACSLTARSAELKNYLSTVEKSPDIICVQETFLKANKLFKLDGYVIIRNDRAERPGGGLATLIKEGISHRVIDSPANIECLCIEIKSKNIKYVIVNVYIVPCIHVDFDEYKGIFNFKNAIITGDFNAHNTLWGSSTTDSRGQDLENLLEETECVVINTGQPTRQNHGGGMSVLDLTMVSKELASKCAWTVLADTLGSDHLPTLTHLNVPFEAGALSPPRWILNKADWPGFREECRELINNSIASDDIEVFSSNISDAIITAATNNIPKTGISSNKKYRPLPYWNESCSNAIRSRNMNRNKLNKSHRDEDGMLYRKSKGIAQKVIKTAASEHWQQYCNTIDSSTKLGAVWRMSRKMSGVASKLKSPNLIKNNEQVETCEEKANLLAETFSKISSSSNYSSEFLERKNLFEKYEKEKFTDDSTEEEQKSSLNEKFSSQELSNAIKHCKAKSTPGPDNISYEMIKNLPIACTEILLQFYNQIWLNDEMPASWKHALILPIPKPNKIATDPNSYRPISLSSCICKVMERLVTDRLTWHLENNKILINTQSGFRKKRSTIDQIMKLQDAIHKSIKSKGYTVGVFLDLEKAYDMLWRAGLMTKLKAIGINGKMFMFIENFLKNRTFQVLVGDKKSSIFELENGTPQGSIISPILFLIMINDICMRNNNVELSLYADDSAIYKSGKDLNQIIKDIQKTLDDIHQWCQSWGFKISVAKSCGVIFTIKRIINIKNPLMLDGSPLNMSDKVKFLGLIFDKKLNWIDHIKYIEERCKGRLNLMRSLAGTKFGASKKCLLIIYKSLIRSVIDYGAEAYDSGSVKARLDSIQGRALRICCGAMIGTPLSALQNETGELPLSLRRKRQLIAYDIKIKCTIDHPAKNIVMDHWINHYKSFKPGCETFAVKVKEFTELNNLVLEPEIISPHPPWHDPPTFVDTTISRLTNKQDPPQLIKSCALNETAKYDHCLAIHTDGSKAPDSGRVGAALFIPERRVSLAIRLTDGLSVFSAELTALRLALEWVEQSQSSQEISVSREIAIFSDSLSALTAIESSKSKTRPNIIISILGLLNKISKHKVYFVWIPAHVAIDGNEEADRLAKSALSHAVVDLEVAFERLECMETVNKYIENKWQEMYHDNKTGAHYKAIEPKVSQKIKFKSQDSRLKEITLSRLRLGKCRLNYYLYKMKRHEDGLCSTCKVPETIEHYLMSCRESEIGEEIKVCCEINKINFELKSILTNNVTLNLIYGNVNRII